MFSNYINLTTMIAALTNTLFSNLFIHVILLTTLLIFCSKKKNKSQKEDSSERPQGGGNESSHFTPPHISAAPGRSLLRQKQSCPVHFQFTESDDEMTPFVDSANSSDIEFDSTQSATSDLSFLKRCTCFCAQKRVRFQCPPSNSTKSFSFGFH